MHMYMCVCVCACTQESVHVFCIITLIQMNQEEMVDKHVRKSQSAGEGQLANWLSRVLSKWNLPLYVCLSEYLALNFAGLET